MLKNLEKKLFLNFPFWHTTTTLPFTRKFSGKLKFRGRGNCAPATTALTGPLAVGATNLSIPTFHYLSPFFLPVISLLSIDLFSSLTFMSRA